MTRNFSEYLARKRSEYGRKFDPSGLDPRFVPYYENEKRIEVDLGGEIKRGTVGVTTGWKPVFLLMLTRRSSGSIYMLGPTDKIIREAQ